MSYNATSQKHGKEITVYYKGKPAVTFHGDMFGRTDAGLMALYLCEALNGDASGLLSFVWAHDYARFDKRITEGKDAYMLAHMVELEHETVKRNAANLGELLREYLDTDCSPYEQRTADMIATEAVHLRMAARYTFALKRAQAEYERVQKGDTE